jgi:hypothetical protein
MGLDNIKHTTLKQQAIVAAYGPKLRSFFEVVTFCSQLELMHMLNLQIK